MVTSLPSTRPASLRPLRNAAARLLRPSPEPELTTATTGNADCCARTTDGHAPPAATPPTSATNSRRLIATPSGLEWRDRINRRPPCGRAIGGVDEIPLTPTCKNV